MAMDLAANSQTAILSIVKKTNRDSGLTYLEKTCQAIGRQFKMPIVMLATLDLEDENKMCSRVFCKHGDFEEAIQYDVRGTPCENVIEKSLCIYNGNVQQLFPQDKALVDLGMVSYAGIPLTTASGQPFGAFVILSDQKFSDVAMVETILTSFSVRIEFEIERMDLEAERQARLEKRFQDEKMQLLGKFAGGITHELNNVLMGIGGNLKVLQMLNPESEFVHDAYFESAVRASNKATNLVKQIMMFAKEQSSIPTKFDLVEMTRNLVFDQAFRAGNLIELKVESEPAKIEVLADAVQIEQMILHLLVNAIHACKGQESQIKISLNLNQSGEVKIQISDTGVGIPNESQSRIFDPFYVGPNNGNGVGIGLAIVANIVEQNDGSISVASEVGKGTCFEILLPIGAILSDSNLSNSEII